MVLPNFETKYVQKEVTSLGEAKAEIQVGALAQRELVAFLGISKGVVGVTQK